MSWVTPQQFAAHVVLNVCELPDYTSPDGQPDLLQCTTKELELCVVSTFEHFGTNPRPNTPPGDLLQRAARMLMSVREYGYQKGTGMPINRHIREWLAEYEKATGDTAHRILATDVPERTPP